jgi:chaperone modulatory protein CbpM
MSNDDLEYEVVQELTVTELSRFCQVERTTILALVEHGILTPSGASQEEWAFDTSGIQRAVKARRLEQDLGLNLAGIALVLDLLEERAALLRRLHALEDS